MSSIDPFVLRMNHIDHRLGHAKQQVALLTEQIDAAQRRYDNAVAAGHLSFRYTGRLKLATLQGVRNMYCQYICHCGRQLDVLHGQLLHMLGVAPTDWNVAIA